MYTKYLRKFHAEERCLDFSQTDTEVLLIDISTIRYIWCVCRSSSNSINGSMGQVMGIIVSLVSDIRKVMAEMSLLMRNTHRPNDSVVGSHVLGHNISETTINQMSFRHGNAIRKEIR